MQHMENLLFKMSLSAVANVRQNLRPPKYQNVIIVGF
jgi:hypothetical protein